jgi:hypothetical protein
MSPVNAAGIAAARVVLGSGVWRLFASSDAGAGMVGAEVTGDDWGMSPIGGSSVRSMADDDGLRDDALGPDLGS